jgi:putative glutamine amidotransferase
MAAPTRAPRIVVTVSTPADGSAGDGTRRRNALYARALEAQGARPILVHPALHEDERRAALQEMDGLLLAGGPDIDPGRYGRPNEGSEEIDRDRDHLEAEAWEVARSRGLPVLGICRGMQAINVFAGGRLLQDVGGHRGPAYGEGPALTHPLRLVPGTRLARILLPHNVGGGVLEVNSYHHQAVRANDLAPGLRAAGWSASPAGEIVEALEGTDERIVLGVQCHPERTESTPAAFDRLFRFFVDACRGPLGRRPS